MPVCHELVHHCLCRLVETNLYSLFSAFLDMCCIKSLENMVCADQLRYFNAVEYFCILLFTLFNFFLNSCRSIISAEL